MSYTMVNTGVLKLLVELLQVRRGHPDDERLQELLIALVPDRKPPGRELRAERKSKMRKT